MELSRVHFMALFFALFGSIVLLGINDLTNRCHENCPILSNEKILALVLLGGFAIFATLAKLKKEEKLNN